MCLLLIFFLLVSCTAVAALPPKGCTSCLMAPVEERVDSGVSQVSKKMSSTGCFVQTLHCSGRSKEAETFLMFNGGRKGVFAPVEQTVELTCNTSGEWEFTRNDFTLVVTSLACLST